MPIVQDYGALLSGPTLHLAERGGFGQYVRGLADFQQREKMQARDLLNSRLLQAQQIAARQQSQAFDARRQAFGRAQQQVYDYANLQARAHQQAALNQQNRRFDVQQSQNRMKFQREQNKLDRANRLEYQDRGLRARHELQQLDAVRRQDEYEQEQLDRFTVPLQGRLDPASQQKVDGLRAKMRALDADRDAAPAMEYYKQRGNLRHQIRQAYQEATKTPTLPQESKQLASELAEQYGMPEQEVIRRFGMPFRNRYGEIDFREGNFDDDQSTQKSYEAQLKAWHQKAKAIGDHNERIQEYIQKRMEAATAPNDITGEPGEVPPGFEWEVRQSAYSLFGQPQVVPPPPPDPSQQQQPNAFDQQVNQHLGLNQQGQFGGQPTAPQATDPKQLNPRNPEHRERLKKIQKVYQSSVDSPRDGLSQSYRAATLSQFVSRTPELRKALGPDFMKDLRSYWAVMKRGGSKRHTDDMKPADVKKLGNIFGKKYDYRGQKLTFEQMVAAVEKLFAEQPLDKFFDIHGDING